MFSSAIASTTLPFQGRVFCRSSAIPIFAIGRLTLIPRICGTSPAMHIEFRRYCAFLGSDGDFFVPPFAFVSTELSDPSIPNHLSPLIQWNALIHSYPTTCCMSSSSIICGFSFCVPLLQTLCGTPLVSPASTLSSFSVLVSFIESHFVYHSPLYSDTRVQVQPRAVDSKRYFQRVSSERVANVIGRDKLSPFPPCQSDLPAHRPSSTNGRGPGMGSQ